ncbi:MAG: DUF4468 domain-containing protein [Bacteroides sp.]|nr:DUF4468 domain-containing protein [Bacteroides sp.]
MRRIILVAFYVVCSLAIKGFAQANNHVVDAQRNVVFSLVMEDLPLSSSDILSAANDYLNNAYKDTKYNISAYNPEAGFIIGEGIFNSFFQHNNLVKASIFNAPFQLRIDAKDNRARVQFIARNYEVVELSDMSDKKKNLVLISEAENSKMYKNAFKQLEELAGKTIAQMSEAIKAQRPQPVASDEW